MFYLIEWVVLIVLTLIISIAAFFWAFRNGQFEDQKRAAYFPLRDLPPESVPARPAGRVAEVYVLLFGSALILGALFLVIWYAAYHS